MMWFVIGGALSVAVVAWAKRLQRETDEAAEARRMRLRSRRFGRRFTSPNGSEERE